MDQEILKKLGEIEEKLDEQGMAVRRMRQYFFWTLVISVGVVILPLIGLSFLLPQFLSSYGSLGI